jgi:hypothetical protein
MNVSRDCPWCKLAEVTSSNTTIELMLTPFEMRKIRPALNSMKSNYTVRLIQERWLQFKVHIAVESCAGGRVVWLCNKFRLKHVVEILKVFNTAKSEQCL